MFKRNADIRESQGKLSNWVIAEKLGIHENTFYRWMRAEMSEEKKEKVLAVISEINNEMQRKEVQ